MSIALSQSDERMMGRVHLEMYLELSHWVLFAKKKNILVTIQNIVIFCSGNEWKGV